MYCILTLIDISFAIFAIQYPSMAKICLHSLDIFVILSQGMVHYAATNLARGQIKAVNMACDMALN